MPTDNNAMLLAALSGETDPSTYQAILNANRNQAISQALTQQALSGPNLPQPVSGGKYTVAPKLGIVGALAPLAQALAANKLQQNANTGMAAAAAQTSAPYLPGGQPIPGSGGYQQIANSDGSTSSGQGPPAPVQFTPINPRNPQGLPAGAVARLAMSDPKAYADYLRGPEAWQMALLRNNGDPNAARADLAAQQQKALQTEVRPGNTLYSTDASGNPIPQITAPQNGINTQWQNGQPVAGPISGYGPAAARQAAELEAAKQGQIPVDAGVDKDGNKLYKFVRPPGLDLAPNSAVNPPGGASAPSATPPGAPPGAPTQYFPKAGVPASAAVLEGQREGAKLGQAYAGELAKNAAGATEVRRSLAELQNLQAQAPAGASNHYKALLGSYMIAAGATPENVSQWLGVDVGALQAAQKQTATLAVNSIHSMTSRGTNFDLDTFMRNNPNLDMSSPQAFARVAQYMDNKAMADIQKQREFQRWKVGKSPDSWETDFTSHWNELQNQAIDAGKYTSANPSTRPPAAPGASAPAVQTATGANGEKYVLQNGQWVMTQGPRKQTAPSQSNPSLISMYPSGA